MPQPSAVLDRYKSIGIHANHMNMTKFLSSQDQDYRNVLSELRRFIPHSQLQLEVKSSSTTSQSITNQESSECGNQDQEISINERGQALGRKDNKSCQPPQLVNNFSGTFNTDGGKMIQGSEFNSGGAPMSF